MTHAELLRNHANLASREGGMYYSGEYLSRIAETAESLETENAKLRELVRTLANCAAGHGCDYCPINGGHGYIGETDMCESVHDCMRELGIEAG